MSFAMSALSLALGARGAPLPSVDQPVKTGIHTPEDAAVVIGIESYFVLPPVSHAERDARAFSSFLLDSRGVEAARLRELVGTPNKVQIVRAVEEAGELVGPGGTVWVYFAGHGAASPSTGERVLLPADTQTDLATFESYSVSLAELRAAATRTGATALFVLDTCYTGVDRSGAGILDKRFAVPAWAAPPSRTGEWTAAEANQWSGPLPEARHGAFTYAVLGALRGWADGGDGSVPDHRVTVAEARAWVNDALLALGVTDQRPRFDFVDGDDVVLVAGEALEPPPDLRPRAEGTARTIPTAVQALPTWTGERSGYRMVYLPPGTFEMGSAADEPDRDADEGPATVTLTSGFWAGTTEITQALWEEVMGENPSSTRQQWWGDGPQGTCRGIDGHALVGGSLPVTCVTWDEAVAFANALSKRDKLKPAYAEKGGRVIADPRADGYRLPTEAEWEYAARAGESGTWGTAGAAPEVCAYGNVKDAAAVRTFRWAGPTFDCDDQRDGLAPVGTHHPNAWGLFDTTGNVFEWVYDGYAPLAPSATDPTGPERATARVYRGGSWASDPRNVRLADRNQGENALRTRDVGLRLVRSAPTPPAP